MWGLAPNKCVASFPFILVADQWDFTTRMIARGLKLKMEQKVFSGCLFPDILLSQ
jgi:hypothetical protein